MDGTFSLHLSGFDLTGWVGAELVELSPGTSITLVIIDW